jgi:hypothetical protein
LITRLARRYLPPSARNRLRLAGDRVAASLGYVTPKGRGAVDFRGLEVEPLEALRRVEPGQPVLVDVPLDLCRTLGCMAFPAMPDGDNPYILTAREYVAGRIRTYEGSPLEAYFATVHPKSGADLVGLPPGRGTSILERMEPLLVDLPWLRAPGPQVRDLRFRDMARDAREAGHDLTGDDGWNHIGPVSERKGELEFARLVALVESVATHGYLDLPDHMWVLGDILVGEDRSALQIWGGQHRVAALAALDHPTIPLKLRRQCVYRRASVGEWPGVLSGAFTEAEALHVFDRVVDGRPPPFAAARWPHAWTQGPAAQPAVPDRASSRAAG